METAEDWKPGDILEVCDLMLDIQTYPDEYVPIGTKIKLLSKVPSGSRVVCNIAYLNGMNKQPYLSFYSDRFKKVGRFPVQLSLFENE